MKLTIYTKMNQIVLNLLKKYHKTLKSSQILKKKYHKFLTKKILIFVLNFGLIPYIINEPPSDLGV